MRLWNVIICNDQHLFPVYICKHNMRDGYVFILGVINTQKNKEVAEEEAKKEEDVEEEVEVVEDGGQPGEFMVLKAGTHLAAVAGRYRYRTRGGAVPAALGLAEEGWGAASTRCARGVHEVCVEGGN